MNIQNQVSLVGYVANEPRFKKSENEDKAELFYTLAVSRTYKNSLGNYEVDFIPVNVYGKQAINMSKLVEKGTLLLVYGSIQMTKLTEGKKANMYFYQHAFKRFNTNRNQEQEERSLAYSNESPFETIETMDYLRNEY